MACYIKTTKLRWPKTFAQNCKYTRNLKESKLYIFHEEELNW